MSIVSVIKKLATERKITIAELERQTGISNGQIRKWDDSRPSVDKLQQVANYFNVSTDYLLGRTDVPQWATNEDVVEIDRLLALNTQSVSYGGRELTAEDRELANAAIRLVLYKQLKAKKEG